MLLLPCALPVPDRCPTGQSGSNPFNFVSHCDPKRIQRRIISSIKLWHGFSDRVLPHIWILRAAGVPGTEGFRVFTIRIYCELQYVLRKNGLGILLVVLLGPLCVVLLLLSCHCLHSLTLGLSPVMGCRPKTKATQRHLQLLPILVNCRA